MVGVQQMVRATCLQVMGAPPGQLAEYRREVLELHALIQGFRQDVADLKQQQKEQQVFTLSSPSTHSANGSVTGFESEETVLADANDTVLRVTWEEMPTRSWYEGRPLPLFNVRLDAENGGGAVPDGIRLRASFLNGRGGVEETKANGTSALVAGERYAYVAGGRAVWEQLVVCEASSKHYGSFTILIDAVEVTLSRLDLTPNPHPNPHPHPHPHANSNPNPSPNPHPRRVKICDFGWSRFKTIDSGKTFFHGWQVRGVARSK